MLIECLIRRQNGTLIENLFGRDYRFMPNSTGQHVCEVDDPQAIERLLSISCYKQTPKGTPGPLKAKKVREPVADPKNPIPAGAPAQVDRMTRTELLQYARNLGMREPHPSITDEKLRLNITVYLAERYAIEDEPADEADEAEEVAE